MTLRKYPSPIPTHTERLLRLNIIYSVHVDPHAPFSLVSKYVGLNFSWQLNFCGS